MPLWGTRQSGGNSDSRLNFTDLRPGDDLALLDGTETIATGSKSIAFARGASPGGMDAGTTFQVTGCSGGTVIDIQAANVQSQGPAALSTGAANPITFAQLDALFVNDGGTITGNGFWTDIGRSSFYRVIVTTYVADDVPVVTVKR